jgi:hypothetical protein
MVRRSRRVSVCPLATEPRPPLWEAADGPPLHSHQYYLTHFVSSPNPSIVETLADHLREHAASGHPSRTSLTSRRRLLGAVLYSRVGCSIVGCSIVGCSIVGCSIVGCSIVGCSIVGCSIVGFCWVAFGRHRGGTLWIAAEVAHLLDLIIASIGHDERS